VDSADFDSQIRSSWHFLSGRLNIGRAFIWNRSLAVSDEFRNVALDDASDYGLSLSHYNILLTDYSYFQFSFETEWRLAYFPNPWIAGVEAAAHQLAEWEGGEADGSLSHEDVSMLMDEFNYYGSIPPIRFEYSKSQYKEIAHPAAHFHIGRDTDNRWPVAITIGPKMFTMLVAKMYYRKQWSSHSKFYGGSGVLACVDHLLMEVSTEAGLVHDFTDIERRSPHFGRSTAPLAPKSHEGLKRRSRGRTGRGRSG
jgi:hypothetical protein